MISKYKALVAVAASVAAIGLGAGAAVAISAPSAVALGPGTIHGCVTGATRTLEHVFTDFTKGTTCPAGSFLVVWNQKGPQGIQGPPGPKGPPGPAELHVTPTTQRTNWTHSSAHALTNCTPPVLP